MVKAEKSGELEENGGINMKKAKDIEHLRGKIVVLNPEKSEIAKNMDIKEKGVYGAKFR